MSIKLIFLDIDGVLNDIAWNFAHPSNNTDDFIDPKRVLILNRILKETGSRCVLSSDWRFTFSASRMQEHLIKFGFLGEIIGATAAKGGSRFTQISDWIDQSPVVVDDFIILDDISVIPQVSSLLLKFEHMVNPKVGLTEADADIIIARLGKI